MEEEEPEKGRRGEGGRSTWTHSPLKDSPIQFISDRFRPTQSNPTCLFRTCPMDHNRHAFGMIVLMDQEWKPKDRRGRWYPCGRECLTPTSVAQYIPENDGPNASWMLTPTLCGHRRRSYPYDLINVVRPQREIVSMRLWVSHTHKCCPMHSWFNQNSGASADIEGDRIHTVWPTLCGRKGRSYAYGFERLTPTSAPNAFLTQQRN